MQGYNPKKEEVYEIQGDIQHGMSSTMCMTRAALGHPKVRYYDKKSGNTYLMTCDVYLQGDELMVHLICPRCRHNLSIRSTNKNISYDKDGDVLNFVEPFKCSWEMSDELLGEARAFGFSLCNWQVAIDNGVAKDA